MPKQLPDSITENMDEGKILSFIVRIWREEAPTQKRRPTWRGHITPIPDGERQYFTDIRKIPTLIAAYLKSHR